MKNVAGLNIKDQVVLCKMKNHRFIYKGNENYKNIYLVRCIKTGGEFSTTTWDKGLTQKNICLCCKEEILQRR